MEVNYQSDQIEFDEISLTEIFVIMKRNLSVILAVSLIFGILSFAYTKLFVSKEYVSSGTMIVNTKRDEGSYITSDEIRSAQTLANVFTIIIKSDPVMNDVINNLSLDMNINDLAKLVTVTSVDQTQVMKVSVKTGDPRLSQKITNEILKVSPKIIVDTAEAGSVKQISPANLNENPVSPNAKLNAMIATILGLMISVGAVFLIDFLDKTFKSEEDIEKYLGIPVIGVIPNVKSVSGVVK